MNDILIVEDERIVSMDLADRLKRHGYGVRDPVSSGESAVSSCVQAKPDLVLMDISIDGPMDGIEAAHRIRETAGSFPIIFLTAYSDSESLERAKAVNPSGYLLKPFQEQNLIVTVEMALSRARLERKLRRQEQLLHCTVEGLDTAVATVSSEGVIEVANAALAKLVGLDNTASLDGSVFDDVVRLSEFSHADDGSIRSRLETVTGEKLPVGYVEHTFEEVQARVISLEDLRSRVTYERALLSAAREAEEIAEARNRFMSSISHELRTPLNSIMGMSDLAMDLSTDTTQQEYLQIMRRAADSLLHIITSILNYTRVQSDTQVGQIESVDLRQFIEDILLRSARISESTPVSITPEVDSRLPTTVTMNAGAVREILRSIYENAVKFSGKGLVRVAIRRNSTRSAIDFVVEDEGPGIPESERDRIFEPFSQGQHDAAREAGGAGMGLSIAKHLAERSNASLTVRSAEGQGSTFTLSVPVTVEDDRPVNFTFSQLPQSDSYDSDVPEESSAPEESSGTKNLLLVEDEAINRLVNARVLERLGHRVRVTDNGQGCLDVLSEQDFDLVFMDVRMPEMGGVEATRRIRAGEIPSARDVPIVALTAYVLQSEIQQCYEAGMNAVITKPFHANELRDVVNHFTYAENAWNEIDEPTGNIRTPEATRGSSAADEIVALLSEVTRCVEDDTRADFLKRLNGLRSRDFDRQSTKELLFRLMLACRRGDIESAQGIARELERLAGEGAL